MTQEHTPFKTEFGWICSNTGCDKNFTRVHGLKRHSVNCEHNPVKQLKQKSEPKEPCPHCGNLYAGGKNLANHIARIHFNRRPWSCELCDKSFVYEKELTNHVKWRHKKESFKCSMCPKKLSNRRQWAIHEATVCRVRNGRIKDSKQRLM